MIIRDPRDDRLVEFKPLTDGPVYLGEIDPLGLYLYENYRPDVTPQFDDHLLIVDGRWIFHKGPNPHPADAIRQLLGGRFKKDRAADIPL